MNQHPKRGESAINSIFEIETSVCEALRNFLVEQGIGDPQQLGESNADLSAVVSHLFSWYLTTAGWDEGWLDGVVFDSICQISFTQIAYSGLLVWNDRQDKWWLEPFQSHFVLRPFGKSFQEYKLCFRSKREDRQKIPYNRSIARVTRQISMRDSSEPIDDSEWVYVFNKSDAN